MKINFDNIIRLRQIRIQKSELSAEESKLTEPILKDKSLISKIYSIFKRILEERDCPANVNSVYQRKKFIFIVMYLFSPNRLADGKTESGIRKEISKVTGVAQSVISDNCDDIIFQYQYEKNLKEDINYLFDEIIKNLQAEELIN